MKNSQPHHPTFAELLALTVDELPQARADEIREHLLGCGDCLEQVTQLLRLPDEPPTPEMAISDADQAKAWSRLEATLDAVERSPARPEVPLPVQPRQPLTVIAGGGSGGPAKASIEPTKVAVRRRWPSLMKAAALLLAGAGLGILADRIFAPAPSATGGVTALKSREFYVRGPEEEPEAAVCPKKGDNFVWTLVLSQRSEKAETATVAIRSAEGKVDRLAPKPIGEDNLIVLILPWSSIPNGKYVVEVEAEGDGGKNVREEFPVAVECQ